MISYPCVPLVGGGPEVPIDPALLPNFRACFMVLWFYAMKHARGRVILPRNILDGRDPTPWLTVVGMHNWLATMRHLFFQAHNYVSRLRQISLLMLD